MFLIQRQNEKPQRPLTPSADEVIVISSGDDYDAISCRRELRSLGMLLNQCSPFLLDIFGSDTAKEKGLIDAENCDDFDAKLLSLEETWNKREKTERGLTDESNAEFHQYFLSGLRCPRHEEEDDLSGETTCWARRKFLL